MNRNSEIYYVISSETHLSMTISWSTATAILHDHPDANITSYNSDEEAFNVCSKLHRKRISLEKKKRDAEHIPTYYTDGSYQPDRNKAGYAAVLVQNGEVLSNKVGKMAHNQPKNSTTAEMAAVMGAIGDARGRGYKKIVICYDCKAVKDPLETKKEYKDGYVRNYVAYMKKHMENIEIEFRKVKAHASEEKGGNRYNKEADKLAKRAIA